MSTLSLLETHPAGLSSESFFSHHTAIHDAVKGRLASTYLTKMCPVLSRGFYDSLCFHDNEGEMELMEFVRSAMFDAVVKQLFGHQNVPQTKVSNSRSHEHQMVII